MFIYWHGHACFRLRTQAANASIVTDPFQTEEKAQDTLATVNDAFAVTVSNRRPMHNTPDAVPGQPRVYDAPGEYEQSGAAIRAVMTPIPEGTPRVDRNVAYAISIDGIIVCHLGAIAVTLTPQQIQNIAPVDVIIAPASGPPDDLLKHEQIAQLARQMGAKVIIPMMYRPDPADDSGEPIECQPFLRAMGAAQGSAPPQSRLQLTAANLPSSMQVMTLNPVTPPRQQSRRR